MLIPPSLLSLFIVIRSDGDWIIDLPPLRTQEFDGRNKYWQLTLEFAEIANYP